MNKNDSTMINGNESANYLVTEAGVYRRDFAYDENTGLESEVFRYIKKQHVQIDNSLLIANRNQMNPISTDYVTGMIPIASVGAVVYLAIKEGPDLISEICYKIKKWLK